MSATNCGLGGDKMTSDELREWRAGSGRTQEQLAAELDVTNETVSRWERGQQRISRVVALAIERLQDRDRGIAA